MTIPLTGAAGLFTRLGFLFGGIADINALRGGTATARVLSGANMASRVIGSIDPAWAASTALPQIIDGILGNLTSFQSSSTGFIGQLKKYGQNTLLAMYALDQQQASSSAPLSQLVSGINSQQALSTLIAQM